MLWFTLRTLSFYLAALPSLWVYLVLSSQMVAATPSVLSVFQEEGGKPKCMEEKASLLSCFIFYFSWEFVSTFTYILLARFYHMEASISFSVSVLKGGEEEGLKGTD